MRLESKMVLVITSTLVHLAVLGSGALFAKWRTEEQVLEEKDMPEVAFRRRGTKVRRAWGKISRGAKRFKLKRRARQGSTSLLEEGDPLMLKNVSSNGSGKNLAGKTYTEQLNNKSAKLVERRRRERGVDAKVNMLILMSDTGGGHRASAQALEAALEEMYPSKLNVTMVDIWTEHSRWPYSHSVPAYQYAAKNPLVWRAMYEYARFPPTRFLNKKMLAFQNFGLFTRAIEQYNPDMVISVHPLCQDLPLKVLEAMGPGRRREIPFVTVVTDLGGAHPTWFNPNVDKVFIASDAVMRVAFREGVKVDKINQLGLPIRPAFWNDPRPREELRAELGLEEQPPAVMIMGGGDGVGGMGAIAKAVIETLSKELERSQVVVVCGKNQIVKRELEETTWPDSVRVIVKGFLNNMDEWMGAVDCLVTKAGPGTIAEATIRGLPLMLSNYLPGQEEGNVPYVIDGGFGDYSKHPGVIGSTVAGWLKDPEKLLSMKYNALRAAKPKASYDIAQELADMMFLTNAEVALMDAEASKMGEAEEGGGGWETLGKEGSEVREEQGFQEEEVDTALLLA